MSEKSHFTSFGSHKITSSWLINHTEGKMMYSHPGQRTWGVLRQKRVYKSMLQTPEVHKRSQKSLLFLPVGLICSRGSWSYIVFSLNQSLRKEALKGPDFLSVFFTVITQELRNIPGIQLKLTNSLLHWLTRIFSPIGSITIWIFSKSPLKISSWPGMISSSCHVW